METATHMMLHKNNALYWSSVDLNFMQTDAHQNIERKVMVYHKTKRAVLACQNA